MSHDPIDEARAGIACRGLLFDCDGVLVDSDASVLSAWSRWAVRYDFEPGAVIDLVHGRRSADTVGLLIDAGRRAAALALIDEFELQDAETVMALPGAAGLVAGLPPSAWAVVTSGVWPLATARLAAAGILSPPVLVTAGDVSRGKPDPEGYLAAAAALGIPAAECVVFEDAPNGIVAARAAGVGAVVGIGARSLEADVDIALTSLTGVRWAGGILDVSGADVIGV